MPEPAGLPPAAPKPAAPEPDVPQTCMAFDMGTRRIGVAIGERRLGRARPLGVVANRNGSPDWPAIERLLREWMPDTLIVGVPLTLDGTEQPMTFHARGFLRALAERTGLPTCEADERLSSNEAARQQAQMRRRGQRRRTRGGDLDALAAALILENWFEQPPPGPAQPD